MCRAGADRRFFNVIEAWVRRSSADLEQRRSNDGLTGGLGIIGRLFMEIEAEAFAMDA